MNARHVTPAVRIIRDDGIGVDDRAYDKHMMLSHGHHTRRRGRSGKLEPIRREPELAHAPPEDLDRRAAAAERYARASSRMGDDLTFRLREGVAGIVMPAVVACVVMMMMMTYTMLLREGWTKRKSEHSYS